MPDQETPRPPGVTGLLESSLYVEDPARSAAFYIAIFGFTAIARGDRLWALSTGPAQILLLFRKGLSAELSVARHDGAGQLHLAFAVPARELERWEGWLTHLGISIEHRVTWERGGTSLYFRDPDGHLVEVATPGVWSTY
jgi:catechol 2,3-dioxygenase-like lactoylglutathione lyase family enzyme